MIGSVTGFSRTAREAMSEDHKDGRDKFRQIPRGKLAPAPFRRCVSERMIFLV
jgi:hypothetical protein